MRLDKFLSCAGIVSRKDAGYIVRKGLVTVDGTVAKVVDMEVTGKVVTAYGKEVLSGENLTIAMNKPMGYISATEDKKDKTVMELLKHPFSNIPFVLVGRLDKDTEGLLLLTTDGQFAHVVMSPKTKLEKEYYLTTDLALAESDVKAITDGVFIGEGETVHGTLKLLSEKEATLTITEGKFHQIKRMMFAVGKTVTYLKRIRIGNLHLDALEIEVGDIKVIKKEDIF